MKIIEVFSVRATNDDCLKLDFLCEDENGVASRSVYAYRASDPYSPLTPIITQWLADNNPEILPYMPPPEPTPEELRAQMPIKSMVEFRAVLRKVSSPVYPNGIYAADINAMIDQIADIDLQEEARDYFNLGQYAERINPWVGIFGLQAGLTPEEIDVLWVFNSEM